MDDTSVQLPMEDGWDHQRDAHVLIGRARYAIIGRLPGQARTVRLVKAHEGVETVRYTALQLTVGDGLHYDGDGAMRKEWLSKNIEQGRYETTMSWPECERYLLAPHADYA